MCFISSIYILVPAGFEPGTFGVTATNVTVSTNGPRSQVKPGHPGPLAFFSHQHFLLLTDKKKIPNFPPPPIGPRGFFPASAVFQSCITGNSGHSGRVCFWQGKFPNRHFVFQPTRFFPTNILFFQPAKKRVFPTDKVFMFQRTPFFPLGPRRLFSASAVFG